MNLVSHLLGLFLALLTLPFPAYSHGNNPHTPSAKLAEVELEQKAWGIGSTGEHSSRVVEVTLDDTMRFEPGTLNFEKGETIRFRVTNKGRLMHEFVLGTKDQNQEHAELMKRVPNMEHEEPYMAHVQPGETVELIWNFNQAGQFEFACLIAGHYDAGMHGTLTVQSSEVK